MSFDLPSLPQGWSYVPLERLAQKNSVTYGVVQPGTHVDHGVPIVRVNNFKDGRVELSELMRIKPEIESKYGRTRLQGGEVLLTIVGSVGQVAVVSKALKGFNVARAVAVIHPQEIDPNWLALCLRSPLSQHLLGSRANTTVQTTINLKDLRALPVPVAPEYERRKIIELIGSLDDRITLLRETNATLEAIAQALFKSWFVYFDPVRANAEGLEPEGMDSATAGLFPDSFEESELGLVPKGWRVRGIDETCQLGRGSSPRPIQQFMGGDVPWIKISDATASDGMFVFDTKEMIIQDGVKNSVKVQPGDLIMSNSASCGITVFVELDGCVHDGWLYFKNYQYINKNFLFFWLRKIANHLVHIADGSVQKNLNIALVSSQKIICPSADVLQAFEIIAGPLLGRVRENCIQAKTLTQLRDILLPRLISGQLRLPEAEVMVEEVCA